MCMVIVLINLHVIGLQGNAGPRGKDGIVGPFGQPGIKGIDIK